MAFNVVIYSRAVGAEKEKKATESIAKLSGFHISNAEFLLTLDPSDAIFVAGMGRR